MVETSHLRKTKRKQTACKIMTFSKQFMHIKLSQDHPASHLNKNDSSQCQCFASHSHLQTNCNLNQNF